MNKCIILNYFTEVNIFQDFPNLLVNNIDTYNIGHTTRLHTLYANINIQYILRLSSVGRYTDILQGV